jgi:hydroxyacylglutathione hydrolase
MLNIIPIPALKDNYIWLVIDTTSSCCVVVDPGEADPVLDALQAQSLKPVGILLTHHHADHTAGVTALLKNHTMPVFGPKQETISSVTHSLVDREKIQIRNMLLGNILFKTISIPGHTHGHVAYYTNGHLFCGDTLFTGGCGRVFEGTMAQMDASLQRLAALPDATHIYCGHEYTTANLNFARVVEPDNKDLQQRIKDTHQLRERGLPTVPSTLGLEKATNPFLRCEKTQVKKAAEDYCGQRLDTPVAVFTVLRGWKNVF